MKINLDAEEMPVIVKPDIEKATKQIKIFTYFMLGTVLLITYPTIKRTFKTIIK